MSEQRTVDQHYVPRFYMKNFGEIKGVGRKKKVLISFFQFKGELYREKINAKSICYKSYFYGEDGILEKKLATKENEWSKIISSILEVPEKELEKEEKDSIKEFAVYQYGRTLATLKFSREAISDALTVGLMNSHPEMPKEAVSELVNKKVDEEMESSLIVEISEGIAKELSDLAVSVIKFSTTNKLITSDMPVVMINPFSTKNSGMGNIGTAIFVPLSEDILLTIYDDRMYNNNKSLIYVSSEQDVINLNKYQVISADERIMSDVGERLREVLSDTDVISKRSEFLNMQKVGSSFDGRGTFFAMQSRSIEYLYPISFYKMSKHIYKIPIECRDVFRREYSHESRVSVLWRVYRLPNELKKEGLSPADVNKRKDGYAKLLSFLDDYWKVPKEQRTITPDLMHKLKTVPTTSRKLGNWKHNFW